MGEFGSVFHANQHGKESLENEFPLNIVGVFFRSGYLAVFRRYQKETSLRVPLNENPHTLLLSFCGLRSAGFCGLPETSSGEDYQPTVLMDNLEGDFALGVVMGMKFQLTPRDLFGYTRTWIHWVGWILVSLPGFLAAALGVTFSVVKRLSRLSVPREVRIASATACRTSGTEVDGFLTPPGAGGNI